MSNTATIVTGNTIARQVPLKIDGAAFEILTTAEVKAALVSSDHTEKYTVVLIQRHDAPGADWSKSLVVVEIPGTATKDIKYQGLALLEIKVELGTNDETFHVTVRIMTGQIP